MIKLSDLGIWEYQNYTRRVIKRTDYRTKASVLSKNLISRIFYSTPKFGLHTLQGNVCRQPEIFRAKVIANFNWNNYSSELFERKLVNPLQIAQMIPRPANVDWFSKNKVWLSLLIIQHPPQSRGKWRKSPPKQGLIWIPKWLRIDSTAFTGQLDPASFC